MKAEAERRHSEAIAVQAAQAERRLRETESRAESVRSRTMSAAAQNFANLQDYNRHLTEELMSQTRELQESKLRHARLEHQAAEEREQLNESFLAFG